MRVLLVHPGPHFSVADVCAGWREGLTACGVQVAEYNLGDRLTFYSAVLMERDGEAVPALDNESAQRLAINGLLSACFQYAPDVLLVVSAFFTPNDLLDLIRARGIRVVILHTESPYQDDQQADRARHADLNVVNDPTNLHLFPDGTYYQPHSYRPALHHPASREPEFDFAFVGTGYPSRVRFLESVDLAGMRVALGGNWQAAAGTALEQHVVHGLDECMDNAEAATLYRAAKVSANLYRREANRPELADGWAMGPREVELAACGTFFLRDPRGESDELLPMLPTFDGPAEFSDLLRYYAAHDDDRNARAALARAAVADRTFTNAARRLLARMHETRTGG